MVVEFGFSQVEILWNNRSRTEFNVIGDFIFEVFFSSQYLVQIETG